MPPEFRLYDSCQNMVLAQKWTKKQWTRIESSEINPETYCQVYDKGGKNIQWEKIASSISGA